MPKFPEKLTKKLEKRILENNFRILQPHEELIDFSSNDYLGISKNKQIFNETHRFLEQNNWTNNGSSGARLISGNHPLYDLIEETLATTYQMPSALLFNSGYTANTGFFSSVPQKNDLVLYDELCHASIREGLQLSLAQSYKYKHLDYNHLEVLLQQFSNKYTTIYIVTESVFSMDGDACDLEKIYLLTDAYNAFLVVDEAHSAGYFGDNNTSFVDDLGLHSKIFARIITFGKAYGCHGAAVLGSEKLRDYLTNFARSFIYTTALSPHSLATLWLILSHLHLKKSTTEQQLLNQNIQYFNQQIEKNNCRNKFIKSCSPIQSCIIGTTERVKTIANHLQNNGLHIKPITSPTVPLGTERLRICLHSYNTITEIDLLFKLLKDSFIPTI